jgi:methylated-DNA-[protein]-cysteine S-methyltransferase
MKYRCKWNSPLGPLVLESDGKSLTGLWFSGQKHFVPASPGAAEKPDLPVFEKTRLWLNAYFSGEKPGPVPPASPEGSEFQKIVWKALRKIPYGKTVTYGDIAKQLEEAVPGKTVSPRAVGGAVGRNPVSIIIPCHRVTGKNGSLTGYAGGLDRKKRLLDLENDVVKRRR